MQQLVSAKHLHKFQAFNFRASIFFFSISHFATLMAKQFIAVSVVSLNKIRIFLHGCVQQRANDVPVQWEIEENATPVCHQS